MLSIMHLPKIFALLRYHIQYIDSYLVTFRDYLSVRFSRRKQSKKNAETLRQALM